MGSVASLAYTGWGGPAATGCCQDIHIPEDHEPAHENTGSQRDAASTIFNLPNYRVIDAVDLPDGGRRVVIASTVPPGCPSCGCATKVHSRRSQQVRDVPVAGAAVVVWAKRRWFCLEPACARGTFAEATEQIPRYARSTTRLRDQVVSAVITSGRAASEVARAHGVSWWLVQAALSAAAVVPPDVDDVRVRRLGVDEHRYRSVRWFRTDQGAWRRFEPWMTTLVDLVPQVLGIVDGRDSRAVGDWLAQRSEAWRERIEIVAIDPSAAFRKALRTSTCPGLRSWSTSRPRSSSKRHGHHRQAAPGPRPSRPSRSQGGSGLGAPEMLLLRRHRRADPEGLGAARGRVPHR